MRLSLRKAAHAAMSSAAWQEIRVRSGRDDKVEGGVYLCFGYGGWGERQVFRDAPLAVAFGRGALQVPPLRYAPVGMTRWRVAFTSASVTWDGERCGSFAILPRAVAFGRGAQQVPPLRYAPVGMTRWRVAFTSASVMGDGERCRSFAILTRAVEFGRGAQQVPPLRCAPVGMTKWRGGVYLCVGYVGWRALRVIRDTPCAVAFGRGAQQALNSPTRVDCAMTSRENQ
jgi:hypothetical protein